MMVKEKSNSCLYDLSRQLLQKNDYVARQAMQLSRLLEEDACLHALTAKEYVHQVSKISLHLSWRDFAAQLRQFRHFHLIRLLLREKAGIACTEETMRAWSDCADALITHGLVYCERQLQSKHGVALDEHRQPVQLYVIALGKLGGQELNFSSDIDLIFTFSASGQTDGVEPLSSQHYYTKVIQQFVQLFQSITLDGFVFRVDLRLRPNGDSGPLVCSLAAMETYYQEQGRDWERYAMVKARVIHDMIPSWFKRLITPFVYRRYVDFSVIEALRGMKAMIEREVSLNPSLDDLKRGRGGIREIEFIIQCFQLIRGGKLPRLQQTNAMHVLVMLGEDRLLAHASVLQQAYLFFRKLENTLQIYADQQTHCLPTDERAQAHVLFLMDFSSMEMLTARLRQYQRIVHYAFYAVLSYRYHDDEQRLLTNQLMNVWQGHVESNMAINLLTSLGVHHASRCYQMIQSFRHAPKYRRLTQAAHLRLDRFMVMLLIEMVNIRDTDTVLLHVLHLLENIVGRSAYLALLTENTHAFRRVLYWFEHSPYIASLLVTQPFLLDTLTEQHQSWRLPSKRQLHERLQQKLSSIDDQEMQDNALREFKLTYWLLAACAELDERYTATRIASFLSDLAEVIIFTVLTATCDELQKRYPEMIRIKSTFGLVAYGKLGSREMSYDSDLDLVFLHETSHEDEHHITRLAQKILNKLTTRSRAGILYAVDTRLRPSGSAGLLVSSLKAFTTYQREQAWVWEHQALLRARVLSGTQTLRRSFVQLKCCVLEQKRHQGLLQEEIHAMRTKMHKHARHDAIKFVPGGLIDLEFLTQFLILSQPNAACARVTHTLEQLKYLHHHDQLVHEHYQLLTEAYKHYHLLLHKYFLQSSDTIKVHEDHYRHVLAIRDVIYTSVAYKS
jgi:glutamate-ammonia-ligase adenylyltransferase